MQTDIKNQWNAKQFKASIDAMAKEERKNLKGLPVKMTTQEIRASCLFVVLGVAAPAGNA